MSLDELANVATVLVLAGAGFYLGTIATAHKEDGSGTGCPRRGCRRRPAGQGCNHAPRTDGPASGISHEGSER